MEHFRMELDRVKLLRLIFRSRHRAVRRVRGDLESRRHLRDIIEMAHPADRRRRYIFKNLRAGLVDQHFRLAVLADVRLLHLAAQHMHHQLRAVAEPQNRDAKLKELVRIGRRIRQVAAVRAAGKDDALRIHFFDLLNIDFVRINLTVHITFPDTTGHKLVVLAAEIKDDH